MLSPISVCWLVCHQDYTRTAEQIFMKPGWRMGLGPEPKGQGVILS